MNHVNRSILGVCLRVLLMLAPTLPAHAEVFYWVDFEAPRHRANRPPATGGSDAPSALTGVQEPLIVSSGGSQKLRFDTTGLGFPFYDTIQFNLGRKAKIYRVEFDLSLIAMPESLDPAGSPSFRLLFDAPRVENVEFLRRNGVIISRVYTVPTGQLFGSSVTTMPLPDQSSLHCVIEIDLVRGAWTISMNGQYVHEGPFYSDSGDIDSLRIGSADVGDGPVTVDLDNLVISSIERPMNTTTPEPAVQSVRIGDAVRFTVPPAMTMADARYQWRFNGIKVPRATSSTLTLATVQLEQTGEYRVAVTRGGTTTISPAAMLLVRPRAPELPTSAVTRSHTVFAGESITLELPTGLSGTPPFQYIWLHNGRAVVGGNTANLRLTNVTRSHAGTYTVNIVNDAGETQSFPITLRVQASPLAIPDAAQPQSASVRAGDPVNLTFNPNLMPNPNDLSFQWQRDGRNIAGATAATLALRAAEYKDAGEYTVVISMAGISSQSRPARLTVRERTRAVNLSVRATSGAEENALILGFVQTGSISREMMVRAAGPALLPFGLADALLDPALVVTNAAGVEIARNEDWVDPGAQVNSALFASVGAFPFTPGSRDAALKLVLVPAAYTARVSNSSAAEGTTVAELYDLSRTDGGAGRLVNLSARATIDGDRRTLIIGLVVAGPESGRFLFRAAGPALGSLGVPTHADNPVLSIKRSDGTELASNDDWGGLPELASLFRELSAFPLDPLSRDAALLAVLPAGQYTVVIETVRGSRAGVVLGEAYEVP